MVQLMSLDLASTKHLPSSQAISKGLDDREKPGYWVQMSGVSLAWLLHWIELTTQGIDVLCVRYRQ